MVSLSYSILYFNRVDSLGFPPEFIVRTASLRRLLNCTSPISSLVQSFFNLYISVCNSTTLVGSSSDGATSSNTLKKTFVRLKPSAASGLQVVHVALLIYDVHKTNFHKMIA